MHVLGISAHFHDSAAALIRDGEVLAAAEEERFTRRKHDASLPVQAIAYCLEEAGIGPQDVDLAVFYDKPLLKLDRLLESYLAVAPRGFRRFAHDLPSWLSEKLWAASSIARVLERPSRMRPLFVEHHEAHAASAFFPSPFEEAAILTLDGVGEWTTASVARGAGRSLEILEELRFPHSLGLLYAAFTSFVGFRVNADEYKVMGLAAYGQPVYRNRILEHVIDLAEDGSFRMDMTYFAFLTCKVMTSSKLESLLDGPARRPGDPLTQRERDVAASIQAVTVEVMLRMARHAQRLTRSRNLVLAGGVSLNCVGNGEILRSGLFDRVFVQPAAGDSGGALGAALFAWHQLLEQPRAPRDDSQRGSLLGPSFSIEAVRRDLDAIGASYRIIQDEGALCDRIARLIQEQRVVGHMQGRMEFGPRALGARSILGDPRSPTLRDRLNRRVKAREAFRPFAPAVLRERASDLFELDPEHESPYMQFVARVRAGAGLPAVTHVDGSARIQTVTAEGSPRLHRILRAFESLTGCPAVINTSLNVRGEPIVCTPAQAYRAFMVSDMDALVIESCVLLKEDQSQQTEQAIAGAQTGGRLHRVLQRLGIDPDPDAETLRRSALSSLLGFSALALAAYFEVFVFSFGLGERREIVYGTCVALAALFGALPQLCARTRVPLYLGLRLGTWPLAVAATHAGLGLVFFGVVAPIGWCSRWTGRDPLGLRPAKGTRSQWRAARRTRRTEDYFRQF